MAWADKAQLETGAAHRPSFRGSAVHKNVGSIPSTSQVGLDDPHGTVDGLRCASVSLRHMDGPHRVWGLGLQGRSPSLLSQELGMMENPAQWPADIEEAPTQRPVPQRRVPSPQASLVWPIPDRKKDEITSFTLGMIKGELDICG